MSGESATDRIVQSNQGMFEFMEQASNVIAFPKEVDADQEIVSWYVCLYSDGAELRAEVSCPIDIEGGFFTGFAGGIWIEGLGWMTMEQFLRKQGVVEAETLPVPYDNPTAISASGSEIVGGIAGALFSWMIKAEQVYVCENGQSVLTGFPGGLKDKVAAGAKFGRCEFQ